MRRLIVGVAMLMGLGCRCGFTPVEELPGPAATPADEAGSGSAAASSDGGASDAGVNGAGESTCFVTAAGQVVWETAPPGCVKRWSYQDPEDSYLRPPPAGSACLGGHGVSFDVETRTLTWHRCQSSSTHDPWTLDGGRRVLSVAEASTLEAALRQVRVAGPGPWNCIGYEHVRLVAEREDAGLSYEDSFYWCPDSKKLYVDGVFVAVGAFDALVP